MKITSQEQRTGKLVVRFNCSVGSGVALWSSTTKPVVGNEYDVEFNINETIEKNRNAFPASDHRQYVNEGDSEIELNGMVESMDEDGMAYFRLADDCLIMIESETGSISVGEWLTLKYDVNDVDVCVQG